MNLVATIKLRLSVALSTTQMVQLTSDSVWLIERDHWRPRTSSHYYPRLLRSQSANAVHSQRSMVPVRQHR